MKMMTKMKSYQKQVYLDTKNIKRRMIKNIKYLTKTDFNYLKTSSPLLKQEYNICITLYLNPWPQENVDPNNNILQVDKLREQIEKILEECHLDNKVFHTDEINSSIFVVLMSFYPNLTKAIAKELCEKISEFTTGNYDIESVDIKFCIDEETLKQEFICYIENKLGEKIKLNEVLEKTLTPSIQACLNFDRVEGQKVYEFHDDEYVFLFAFEEWKSNLYQISNYNYKMNVFGINLPLAEEDIKSNIEYLSAIESKLK